MLRRRVILKGVTGREMDDIRRQMRQAILDAIDAIRDETVVADVTRALDAGDIDGAIDAIKWEAGEAVLNVSIPHSLRVAYETAAHGAARELADAIDKPAMSIGFDITNPEAVEFVRSSGGDLIKDWGDTSKEALRGLVADSLTLTDEDAVSPTQLSRQILDSGIGLNERQLNALENFRSGLEDDENSSYTQERIDELVADKAEAYAKDRADMIAHTETMRAANEGNQGLWKQAAERGLINKDVAVQVWKVSNDPCDECDDMDGEMCGVDDEFEGGDPPRHPRCECVPELLPFGEDGEEG